MFITFEGIDGSGKSTHAKRLYEHLSNIFGNERVLITREPGGWSGGSQLRDILLHSNWRPWSEFFLFMADRCEHVEEQIKPALAKGQIVICERYTDSTLAYQGWGKGLLLEEMERLFSLLDFPLPDLTIWLDISVDTAMKRIKARSASDRLEEERFLAVVRRGYEELSKRNPVRIRRVFSGDEEEKVFEEITRVVEDFMDEGGKEKLQRKAP